MQLTAVARAMTPYQAEVRIALEQQIRIAASATSVAACCDAAWDYGGQEMDLM